MSTTTLNKTTVALVPSQSVAAGGSLRAAIDLRTALGGLLTMKIVNGATGPSNACQGNILAAHDDGATPATGAAGSIWSTLWGFSGGTTNTLITEQSFEIPQGVQHLEVEFIGHTVQPVTVKATVSIVTSATSV